MLTGPKILSGDPCPRHCSQIPPPRVRAKGHITSLLLLILQLHRCDSGSKILCPLGQSFSHYNLHLGHLGVLLRCRFWLSDSGWGSQVTLELLDHSLRSSLWFFSRLHPTSAEAAGLSLWAPSRARTPWHPGASLAKQLSTGLFIPSHYHQGKRNHRHAASCLQRASEKFKVQVFFFFLNCISSPLESHIVGDKNGLKEIHKILNDTVSRHR